MKVKWTVALLLSILSMALSGALFLMVWLYGALALAALRWGYVIPLLGPVLFLVWALGVTAAFSLLLSAGGLWGMRTDR
jgi:hypothetical protein